MLLLLSLPLLLLSVLVYSAAVAAVIAYPSAMFATVVLSLSLLLLLLTRVFVFAVPGAVATDYSAGAAAFFLTPW